MLDNKSLLAYDQPIQGKHVKIELLDFNFAVVDSIEGDCVGGSLTKDAESTLRRSGTIELCVPIDNTATTFLDAVNGYTISFGGKIWLDKYIKVYIGIDSLQTGETAWQSFGVCLMDEPTRDFSSTEYRIRFSVIDLMARLTGLRFGQLTAMATVIEAVVTSGSTVTRTKTEDALISVLTELGSIKNYAIYPIPTKYEYLPYDIKVDIGATVWDLLSQFMDILSGWQIYFDDDGILRVEPIPSGVHNPAYPLEYKDIISAKVSTDFQSVKNQIVVYGRTITPSFVGQATSFADNALEVEVENVDPEQDFIVGATTIAFNIPVPVYELPQMSTITLTLHNHTYTCPLVDFGNTTAYVPAQKVLWRESHYCIQLYSATLDNNGNVDPTQPMTWQWLGKQQVSACLVVDNKESPFYINNQIPNSYWGGYASINTATGDVYNITINDQDAVISTLRNGTIIAFMVATSSKASQKITVISSDGTTLLSQVTIYENGSALSAGKMAPDYTIFMVQYDSAGNGFDFLGRHPYALTKVLSGGVYDNIVADLLAQESAKYELYLTTSLQNNIDVSIVPSFALDVNTKIPFADQWAMPYKIADKYPTPLDYFLIKTITYPLGADGTAQDINAIQIYTDENLVGDDYVTPPVSAGFPTQLGTPTISLSGSVLTITGAAEAQSFDIMSIYGQTATVAANVTSREIDLSTIPFFVEGRTYTLAVIAKSVSYYNSDSSNEVTYGTINMPVKGDLIAMNVDGSDKQFRVLNVNGNNAEVVMMSNSSDSQQFAASGQIYAGSALDTYLNSTWYNTLNATAQAAIVDKTFTQDSWYFGNTGDPDYSGYYGTTNPGTSPYTISLGSATFGSSITRHVYALSVQDVLDYVLDTSITDGQLQNYNIWKMFWDITTQPPSTPPRVLWLRSAYASSSSSAFVVLGSNGYMYSSNAYIASNNFAVRPAFTIDLTKITWSPST